MYKFEVSYSDYAKNFIKQTIKNSESAQSESMILYWDDAIKTKLSGF